MRIRLWVGGHAIIIWMTSTIVIGPDDKICGTAVVLPPPEPEQAPEADETEEEA